MNKNEIRALIIDDEALSADMLNYLIERNVPSIKQVRRTTSAVEGLAMIETYKPELVFLDIQMPFLTGFELLAKIPQHSFSVIFTTAYNKYAIKAIRFSAIDYLLKPIDADELKESVDRYLLRKNEKMQLQLLYKNFMSNMNTKEDKNYRLALHTHLGVKLVSPAEIIHCEASNNYTIFHLTDNTTITTSKTIKEYEEMLAEYNFLRVHKSHLVNLQFVQQLTKQHQLLLSNKTLVDVSRRRKPELMEILRKM
ncbi:MAG: response regulator transcription factor [Chitinophagaceae bacterium]|nr:response regulator transcription factor [Chitinophagaceae bacterium]